MISHCCSSIVTQEMIFLIVTRPQDIPSFWFWVIANCFQKHIVAFLDCTESHIFHCLNERQCSSICFLGFILEVHVESTLVVDVISCPEVHTEYPCKSELRKTTPDIGHLLEQLWSSFFVEMSVFEHWRVGVVVTCASCSTSGSARESAAANPHQTKMQKDN